MQERGVKPAAEDIPSYPGASLMNRPLKPPIDHVLKCPRCDSYNTKFCYFNNYSLSQPRHFCKNCRRYWTKGGSLRNVPVGGGCRKNKRSSSKQKSSSDLQINADSAISSLSGSDNMNPNCSVFPDNLSEPRPSSTVYGLMPIQGTQINHSSAPSLFRLPAVFPPLQNGIMGLDFAASIRPGHGDFSALLNSAPHQLHFPKESFNLALNSLNGMNSEEQEGQRLERIKHPSYMKPGFASFSHCLKMEEGQGAVFEGVADQNYWNINGPWSEFCANYGASASPLLQ